MRAEGQGPAAIAKALGCSRMSVYRLIGDGAAEKVTNEPVPTVKAATSRPKVIRVPLNKPVKHRVRVNTPAATGQA